MRYRAILFILCTVSLLNVRNKISFHFLFVQIRRIANTTSYMFEELYLFIAIIIASAQRCIFLCTIFSSPGGMVRLWDFSFIYNRTHKLWQILWLKVWTFFFFDYSIPKSESVNIGIIIAIIKFCEWFIYTMKV